MYMYGEFLAKMFPFGLYVLLYIMVVRISVDFIKKKMFLIAKGETKPEQVTCHTGLIAKQVLSPPRTIYIPQV